MKLVIAEKPSVAFSIASVIGADTKQDGYMEGDGYIVSWCYGHLVEPADASIYDERYTKWDYVCRTQPPDRTNGVGVSAALPFGQYPCSAEKGF